MTTRPVCACEAHFVCFSTLIVRRKSISDISRQTTSHRGSGERALKTGAHDRHRDGGGRIPLIAASGAGAISRFDIGLVIATGMSIGTLFTLFVVPAMYLVLAREHHTEDKAHKTPDPIGILGASD